MTAGCVHPCHANIINFIGEHTPTHNFGTICGCVIDIYFNTAVLNYSSDSHEVDDYQQSVSHKISTGLRVILLGGVAPMTSCWQLYLGHYIAFGEKTSFSPLKNATNKRTADVIIRINHKLSSILPK